MNLNDYLDEEVTVCDKCFCVSCWHGIFYCDDYLYAGITNKTVRELLALGGEHESYIKLGLKEKEKFRNENV